MTFSSPLSLAGRNIALKLAKAGKEWKAAAAVRMPEARGDIREIIGQPVFVPLQKLATIYGKAGLSPATCHGCTCCMSFLYSPTLCSSRMSSEYYAAYCV